MKVLIACEFSGIVRDAFLRRGHNAWSCDLLPTESNMSNGNTSGHLVMDALTAIGLAKWDLMIAHPPCTHLSASGAQYWPTKQDGRQQRAIAFFMALYDCDIPRICVENPVGIMSRKLRRPDQIIQPWQFGEPVQKKTCLWLRGLPALTTTAITEPTSAVHSGSRFGGRRKDGTRSISTLTGRYGDGKNRSRFFRGIAEAMADQWGGLPQLTGNTGEL